MNYHKVMVNTDQQSIRIVRGIDLQFIKIPSGPFVMGQDHTIDVNAFENEFPEHSVDIKEYWICKYLITNAQYKIFVDETHYSPPNNWQDAEIPLGLENHPVVYVNWFDATYFCDWLGQKNNVTICLPSEAEWEKAARGLNSSSKGSIGSEFPIRKLFNYDSQFLNRGTTPVGKFSMSGDSPFGCSDMLGNVWEWTSDWYDKYYYAVSPSSNPIGPENGDCRTIRGGSWIDDFRECRTTARQGLNPNIRNSYTGLRCCITNTHKNSLSNFTRIRFQIETAINQRNWSIASQLLDKWTISSKEDLDIKQIQCLIEKGKRYEQNERLLTLLKIRSLQLQVIDYVSNEDWDNVILFSQSLIGLNSNDKTASTALILAQKCLLEKRFELLHFRLVQLIDFHRIELDIYESMNNYDLGNARIQILKLLPWKTSKIKYTKLLERIDTELASDLKKEKLNENQDTKGTNLPNSSYDTYWKFKEAMISEKWESVIKFGELLLEFSPNSSYFKKAVANAQNKVQPNQSDNNLKDPSLIKSLELQKLTNLAIAENRIEDAKKYITEWLAISPNNQQAKNLLARIQKMLSNTNDSNKTKIEQSVTISKDILIQLQYTIIRSEWDQASILAEKWIQFNCNQSKRSLLKSPNARTEWKYFSPMIIDLVKNNEIFHAAIVASVAIHYSPADINAEVILNTIWKKSQKLGKRYCEKSEYDKYLIERKWFELLRIMFSYLFPQKKETYPFSLSIEDSITKPTANGSNSLDLFSPKSFKLMATNHQIATIMLADNLTFSFVPIRAGNFLLGGLSSDPNVDRQELPANNIHLPDFWIGEVPITVRQFNAFVENSGYITTAEKYKMGYSRLDGKWKNRQSVTWKQPFGIFNANLNNDSHPVTMISWLDAYEFCNWLKEESFLNVQLPSEAEWEKAVRWEKNKIYPWGDFPPSHGFCNFGNSLSGNTKPVGDYNTKYDSGYGCKDMAGNVWEWTRSIHKNYPYDHSDGREEILVNGNRVIRGGAFISQPRDLRCSARRPMEPEGRSSFIGFRVVIQLSEE